MIWESMGNRPSGSLLSPWYPSGKRATSFLRRFALVFRVASSASSMAFAITDAPGMWYASCQAWRALISLISTLPCSFL